MLARRLALLAATLLLVGCPGPILNTATPAPLVSVTLPAGTTMILAEPGSRVPGKSTRGDPRMRAFQRRTLDLYGGGGIPVVEERDAGTATSGASYIVRTEIVEWSEDIHFAPERVICYVTGILTVGLGFIPCADTRDSTDHRIEFEVRLYDATGVEARRVAEEGGGEIELRLDTSARTPLLRRTYEVEMRTGIGAGGSQSDWERFTRDQGERLAELLFQASARDVQSAVASAPRAAPQDLQSIPPTSGGEVLPGG